MFQMQIRAESGEWFDLDEPYKHRAVAADESLAIGIKYDVEHHIRVVAA